MDFIDFGLDLIVLPVSHLVSIIIISIIITMSINVKNFKI